MFRSQSLSRITNLLTSTHIIRKVIGKIAALQASLLNECLSAGLFQIVLKLARAVFIYKKEDRDNPGSYYRPIAIHLLSLGKIFEVIVKRQNWLTTWRKRKYYPLHSVGIEEATITRRSRRWPFCWERIYDTFEDVKSITMIMYHLSKAFDVIPHDILLGKLELCVVREVARRTLSCYLNEKT